MKTIASRILLVLVISVSLVLKVPSVRAGDATHTLRFSRDILPILSDTCFKCHGPDAKNGREGDLRLDDEQDVKRERGGYRVITAGEADQSELLRRITTDDPDERMPPSDSGRSLSAAQIDVLTRWVAQGAPWGQHWALERITRPVLDVGQPHPIDLLIVRRLRSDGMSINPRASRETLIRRLTLDLTGLPPTLEQVDTFLADNRPGAWERLVDRTLASPAFGERMAWDWMEVARYADTNGYQGDSERTMWPWRDWVVRALNQNLPFDEFTVWQLAGDLLPGGTADQVLATAFNRNHMINGEGGRIAEENRVDYVMDMCETMGTAWLGLTLNCCRCHDHKFDPLTQRNYYQFTAFFNQTPVDGGGGNPQTEPVLPVADASQQRQLVHFQQELSRAEQQVIDAETDAARDARNTELERVRGQLEKLRAEIPKVMVMRDRQDPRATFMLDRGLYTEQREEVTATVPAFLPPLPPHLPANRLALATWLVSDDHPLTARVVVNRYWQMLFGIGLVKTAEDLGVQGEFPVHPELLDWLAVEFVESGWDVKHLLRTIVTSETYQRSSAITNEESFQRDPENRLLARGPRFRMPSWMIRDQALAVSGLLDSTLGGPAVFPYQPQGVWEEATFGKKRYQPDTGSSLYRRSLYTFWRRIVGPTIFFDAAKRQICEVKPLRTNTPLHALTTLNDTTFVEAARALASIAIQTESETPRRLALVSRRVLGRLPAAAELTIWQRSVTRAHEAFTNDPTAAQEFLTHGQFQPTAELDSIELATWTAVCLNMLNLDEALNKE